MYSVPKRESDFAAALRTYSGVPLIINPGVNPNFVARNTEERFPVFLNLAGKQLTTIQAFPQI